MERHHEPSLAADYLTRALEAFDDEPAELSTRLLPDTPEGRLAAEYLLAVMEGDRRRASQLILDAVDQGQSVRDVYLRVLLPAQQEVGRMWLVGEINVAEEHFASATTKAESIRPTPSKRSPYLLAASLCLPRTAFPCVLRE
jgi:methanogenic corrinoid protein MtbC1